MLNRARSDVYKVQAGGYDANLRGKLCAQQSSASSRPSLFPPRLGRLLPTRMPTKRRRRAPKAVSRSTTSTTTTSTARSSAQTVRTWTRGRGWSTPAWSISARTSCPSSSLWPLTS